MAKQTNELECDCGHVAGSPFTLRAHQKSHDTFNEVNKSIVKGFNKAADDAVEHVKKVVKRKAK